MATAPSMLGSGDDEELRSTSSATKKIQVGFMMIVSRNGRPTMMMMVCIGMILLKKLLMLSIGQR